jgi:integrase
MDAGRGLLFLNTKTGEIMAKNAGPRIFKDTYKDRKTGKRVETRRWYLEFTDHKGRRHRLAGTTDWKSTNALARNIESLVGCCIGGQRPDAELQRWLEGLPAAIMRKLVSWGLIDSRRAESSKPLTAHVSDYEAVLKSQGKSKTHVAGTISRIRAVMDGCRFAYIRDISGSRVSKYIGGMRDGDDARSATTRNHYLTAFKMFLNWMVADQRVSENPIAHLTKERAEAEKRGVLTRQQFAGLIRHTLSSNTVMRRMGGLERGMLYLLAGQTGFRRGELLTLSWGDMDLADENRACVNIDASRTKNGQAASQPLPPQTAAMFRQWRERHRAADADKVFPNFTANYRPSEMIQDDLVAMMNKAQESLPVEQRQEVKGPVCDHAGRKIDFHSLRVSYISFLADTNTPAKMIQKLARHSTPVLTFNTYARPSLSTERTAVEGLPVLDLRPEAERNQAQKTGTDGAAEICSPSCSRKTGAPNSNEQQQTAKLVLCGVKEETPSTGPKSGFSGQEAIGEIMGRGGFEPPTHGFSVRCSTN